jgi:UMF1 family MFS transporter
MPRLSRAAIGWALYDWAASAYALCILAGFFPILFESYWAEDLSVPLETFWYGLFVSAASLIGAVVAPFLGTLADTGGSRRRWLIGFALVGMSATLGLTLVARDNWPLAGTIFVIGTVGYYGAAIVYNSLLPVVSSEQNRHFVSGLGFAMGYLGGVLLFLASIVLVKNYESFGLASEIAALHLAFWAAVIWWGLFTLPLLLTVREPHSDKPPVSIRNSLRHLWETLRTLGRTKPLFYFLVAYWLYIDGVNTVILMASNYGKTLGFQTDAMLITLVLVQIVGVPSTLLVTWLAERYRARPFLYLGIVLYLLIVLYGATMPAKPIQVAGLEINSLYILGILVGLTQGGIQALSRSTFSLLIPKGRTASYFGVYNMLGQYAALLGPLLMGLIARATGSPRWGVASLSVLFIAGGLVLLRVGPDKSSPPMASRSIGF